jgi:hypothetical protein
MSDAAERSRKIIEEGLRQGRYVRLLPRHDVVVFAPGGDGKRFARLFAETWRRLPYRVRRHVLKHWRESDLSFVNYSPQIELVDFWSQRMVEAGLGGDKAAVFCLGHRLVFWTKIVDAYPDDLVRDLIAHELAHVYQWAIGCDLDEMEPMLCESEADLLVETWGFSSTAMDEWDLEHGVNHVPDLEKMSEAEREEFLERQWTLVQRCGR